MQTANEMPAEILFEWNAAFDHLSRHWYYGDREEDAVRQAFSHLKRSCLDAFKLKVKGAREQYDTLMKLDISIIENGEFQRKMIASFLKIRDGAREARSAEGDNSQEGSDAVPAFDLWIPVYAQCVAFEQDFYANPSVEWAKTKQVKRGWRDRLDRFVVGLVTGLVTALILAPAIRWLFLWLWNRLAAT